MATQFWNELRITEDEPPSRSVMLSAMPRKMACASFVHPPCCSRTRAEQQALLLAGRLRASACAFAISVSLTRQACSPAGCHPMVWAQGVCDCEFQAHRVCAHPSIPSWQLLMKVYSRHDEDINRPLGSADAVFPFVSSQRATPSDASLRALRNLEAHHGLFYGRSWHLRRHHPRHARQSMRALSTWVHPTFAAPMDTFHDVDSKPGGGIRCDVAREQFCVNRFGRNHPQQCANSFCSGGCPPDSARRLCFATPLRNFLVKLGSLHRFAA